MRSLGFFSLLCSAIAFAHFVQADNNCDLSGAKRDVDFPDLEKEMKGMESFQMSVEYTAPDAKQTDYYVEYYDIIERRGRVEGHVVGKFETYLYFTQSAESWNITENVCAYQNITDTPGLLRSDQNEWWYMNDDDEQTVFGPSAMFKYALDTWNSTERKSKMAYMGITEFEVRGVKAQYWRRCDTETSYVDYFFTTDKEEDPLGLGLKRIPLRVFFGGKREGKEADLSTQQFEIINFQPFISLGLKPFQLPKAKECKRGYKFVPPPIPDFSDTSLQFSAEVIYRKVDWSGNDAQYWSYYSKLMMALDVESQLLAYYYTPWSDSSAEGEPTADSPEHVIYDMKHGYAYKTNVANGTCEISRQKTFIPKYKLPGNAGSISLTDPSILYPNSELTFISEGENRGLKVNIFEETVENYILDKKDETIKIPKAIISHSYLTKDEQEVTKGVTKNALSQIQLRFSGRYDKVIEIVTFNFFGFSTGLNRRRFIFDTLKCFKNDDSYSWVTLRFGADKELLENIKDDVPEIEANILGLLTTQSELNQARIPFIFVDMEEDGLEVIMLILGKPPVLLDYLDPEDGKTITGTKEVEGIQQAESCAQTCLETEDNCWGFSICGAVCSFGVGDSAKVTTNSKCKLYRRYNNDTFIPSRALMIQNLRREVETHQVTLVLKGKDDKMVQIEASSIEVTDPSEDEYLFNRLGNFADPRMKVVKAGGKLKSDSGVAVKNMGKLRYDQCQRVCLDFKDCETVSYCLKDSECLITNKFGEELGKDEIVEDDMCNVLTRKYADHFGRSPGNVLSITAKEVLDLDTVEKCARACLKSTKYKCLSFDHCPQDEKNGCKLHTVHYPNSKTREGIQVKSTNCGHYYRKYSTEFKKNPYLRMVGTTVPPLSNLTLEDCSKACMEYGKGTCYGFDFCQGSTMFATTCVLLDTDPSRMKSTYSQICFNFLRTEPQFAPRPYTTGYAGGIGFLCFIIGLVVGALVVFAIAYFRVNRR